MARSRVKLPHDLRGPFEVYVNGVRQHLGNDYEVRAGEVYFDRHLIKEGRLGFWRWVIGAFGVGTYRQNDSVDVRYALDGRPMLAEALDIEPVGQRPS